MWEVLKPEGLGGGRERRREQSPEVLGRGLVRAFHQQGKQILWGDSMSTAGWILSDSRRCDQLWLAMPLSTMGLGIWTFFSWVPGLMVREFKVCYATVTMLRILLVLSNQILTVEQLLNLSFNIISILLVRILWPKKLGWLPRASRLGTRL